MAPEPLPFPEELLGERPTSCAWRRANDPLGQVELPSGDAVRLAVRFGIPSLRLAVPADEVTWKPDMTTHSIARLPITW